jgi:hypothetical protein
MNTFLGFKTEEILTCLLLVVVGYFIAKMFSGCGCIGNGFSVGIQGLPSDGVKCTTKCKARLDSKYQYDCPKSGSCYKLFKDDGTTKCVEPENLTGTSKNKYCISGIAPAPAPAPTPTPTPTPKPTVKCEGKNIHKSSFKDNNCVCDNALTRDPKVKCSYKCKDTNGKITEMNTNEKLSVCNSLDSNDLCHHRLYNHEVLASDVTISGCPLNELGDS